MKTDKARLKERSFSTLTPQSRREFLRASALAMAAASLPPYASLGQEADLIAPHIANVKGANDKINIACIGVGGKGEGDTDELFRMRNVNVVALCDVNQQNVDKMAVKIPNAKHYSDYRKMLAEMDSSIDAVTVSIPDHSHAIATLTALQMGKHVFCQKPLTQTVWEARQVRDLAKAKNLATQMGNQGSADTGLRRAVEVVQAGVLGKVTELHVWTNRPIWPQGIARPTRVMPAPEYLAWDVWLGPAPERPYNRAYEPFNWRGWYDFGCGALGDMACHTVNMPSRALKLGYPTAVELEESSQLFPETFPKSSRIRFEFPEREGMAALKFWWYDGDPNSPRTLRPPPDLTKETWDINPPQDGKPKRLPEAGALLVGDKGMLFSPDDYGTESYIMLKGEKEYTRMEMHAATKAVPRSLPRSPGHKEEWIRMMRGGPAAYSNFDIAAYLTEIILLGCVALRVGPGKKMEWDGPKMMSPSHPEAAQYVRRNNRHGWDVSGIA
ncbi:MAG TPA: Gfo/Idh/MocA family oxidoreductase [Candidatus Acidoferrum sp.]|nr:Gfo/Idh/MocA family oxidoreductase [Candidatus Acidoferrum sp.]